MKLNHFKKITLGHSNNIGQKLSNSSSYETKSFQKIIIGPKLNNSNGYQTKGLFSNSTEQYKFFLIDVMTQLNLVLTYKKGLYCAPNNFILERLDSLKYHKYLLRGINSVILSTNIKTVL